MHDITVLTIIKIHQGWVLIPLSFHHAPSVASDRKMSSVMGRRIKRRDSEMSLVSVSLSPWLALFFSSHCIGALSERFTGLRRSISVAFKAKRELTRVGLFVSARTSLLTTRNRKRLSLRKLALDEALIKNERGCDIKCLLSKERG